MCLIIASQVGQRPDEETIYNASLDNPHGIGLAWAYGGKCHAWRGFSVKRFMKKLDRLPDGMPYVAHFRWATHGAKTLLNCHPFQIGNQVLMAHNGIVHVPMTDPDRSDTWHLAGMLEGAGYGDPEVLRSQENIALVEDFIGRGNKLAFIDSAGRIAIANEGEGVWIDDIWYSNAWSLGGSRWGWWDDKSPATITTATDAPRWESVCDLCQTESYSVSYDAIAETMLCEDCSWAFGEGRIGQGVLDYGT